MPIQGRFGTSMLASEQSPTNSFICFLAFLLSFAKLKGLCNSLEINCTDKKASHPTMSKEWNKHISRTEKFTGCQKDNSQEPAPPFVH